MTKKAMRKFDDYVLYNPATGDLVVRGCTPEQLTEAARDGYIAEYARLLERVYLDTERGNVVTSWELFEEYTRGDVTEADTFGEYVWNCQTEWGGTLKEIPEFRIRREWATFVVLRYWAGNDDGIYCNDWREWGRFSSIEEAAGAVARWM